MWCCFYVVGGFTSKQKSHLVLVETSFDNDSFPPVQSGTFLHAARNSSCDMAVVKRVYRVVFGYRV
jgi:hypothetical protein